jgi:hypothetical protein
VYVEDERPLFEPLRLASLGVIPPPCASAIYHILASTLHRPQLLHSHRLHTLPIIILARPPLHLEQLG